MLNCLPVTAHGRADIKFTIINITLYVLLAIIIIFYRYSSPAIVSSFSPTSMQLGRWACVIVPGPCGRCDFCGCA